MNYNDYLYKNILLGFMIMVYLIPIIYIYYYYNQNKSVSNIICDSKCRKNILFFMVIMGLLAILYEIERNDNISLILIITILIGIYGVIFINEKKKTHYLFATIVFLSIIGFMIRNCYRIRCNFLYLLLFIQIILLFTTIINIKGNIFYSEVFFILNFALYYLYLHYTEVNL